MTKTKQAIAIIGAGGSMGSAIARGLTSGNYRFLFFDEQPDRLEPLVKDMTGSNPEVDLYVIDRQYNACWETDIIILAISCEAEKEIAERIREVATRKIVVSISNPVNELENGVLNKSSCSAPEELQELLLHSDVIKAFFSTLSPADFNRPEIGGTKIDSFVAGNHDEALKTIAELVRTAVFNPVVVRNCRSVKHWKKCNCYLFSYAKNTTITD